MAGNGVFKMIWKQQIRGLFKVFYWILRGGTKKNQEKLTTSGIIPAEIQTTYRPNTNPKAPYAIKYIGAYPVYLQVFSAAGILTTRHSFRYIPFLLIFINCEYVSAVS
jgi:hypothetical protein